MWLKVYYATPEGRRSSVYREPSMNSVELGFRRCRGLECREILFLQSLRAKRQKVACSTCFVPMILLLMTQLSHALRGDDSKQEVHVHIQSAQSSFKSSSCVIRQVRRGSI